MDSVRMIRFKRRQRTNFSKDQLNKLNEVFEQTQYPEPPLRNELARRTNLDPSRIQVWFQNQRAKDKKKLKSNDDLAAPNEDLQPGSGAFNRSLGYRLLDSPPLYHHDRNHNHERQHFYNHNNHPHNQVDQYHNDGQNRDQDQQYHPASKRHRADSFDDLIDDPHNSTLSPFEQKKHHHRVIVHEDQYADDNYYNQQSIRGKQSAKPQTIHVFDTDLANEAAEAVAEGKFESILQFHRTRYGTSTCTPWLPR